MAIKEDWIKSDSVVGSSNLSLGPYWWSIALESGVFKYECFVSTHCRILRMADLNSALKDELTREQKMSLHAMCGKEIEDRLNAAQTEFNTTWETRAKIARQVEDYDLRITNISKNIEFLKNLKKALSW